jgi:hypothetical protein
MVNTWGLSGYGTVLPWGSTVHPLVVPPASQAGNIDDLGVLEATISAIAEEDNEIGGFNMTRLTSAHATGATTLLVESTLDWPATGKVGLGGIVYYYTGKTDTSFTGITHIAGGTSTAGTAIDHRTDSPVTDISQTRSALERLRRALFVAYAEEEDLNVIGRNLGVFRIPIFGDDDQYRDIIQKMAYCPKGTVQGLELAMTGLLGAGNFEIYEDLIMYPNTVFIKVPSSVVISSVSAGKAYLTGHQWDDLSGSSDTLTLSATPLAVQGVTLKNLGEEFDFRNAIPSAVTYAYWEGQTPATAFTYVGSVAEGTGVTQVSGLYTQFKSNAPSGTVYYRMLDTQGARITSESVVECSTTMSIPTGSALTAGQLLQASIAIEDGGYIVRAGVENTRALGLFATEASGHLGNTITLAFDQFYDVTIKKYSNDYVELWVDGQLIDSQLYSAFTSTTTNHRLEFGIAGTPSTNMEVWFKELNLNIVNNTDYWNARETLTGTVSTSNPTRFVLSGSTYTFAAGDVGDGLHISGSSVANLYGGNNNGRWVINSYTSGTTVDLMGEQKNGASVSISNPTRIVVDESDFFTYPDDLGKKIVITGSAVANNGTYVISKLLQPVTFLDFAADFDTPMKETTNICEVSSATFTTEADLGYQLKPVFVTESSLDWVHVDASSFSGTTLTLRQPLWSNGLVMDISLSDVLTGQILKDTDVSNIVIQETPTVLYEYYPFYLSDLLGSLLSYIDTITVAGVIPEFSIE